MLPAVGIRREDKNEWERRVPLAPRHVRSLVRDGLDVHIQPSPIRVFADDEYVEVGATVREDLSACTVVFGIKEFPTHAFRPGQACAFFSHTTKGQAHNMPMLRQILHLGCTLIDYEKVVDSGGLRLLYFGNYAGRAGMIETLHAFGRRLEWEGVATPFLAVRRPLDYGSLAEATAALDVVGRWIAADGLPPAVTPLVVGFAGYGNVSKGAQEVLGRLPVEEVQPPDLAAFMAAPDGHSPHQVYKVVFYERDMVVPRAPGQAFELQDYYDHPQRYEGVFAQFLPHLSILVNGIYWERRYPRLVTEAWLREHWTRDSRLKVLGDISCDMAGAVECNRAAASPGQPTYVYLPGRGEIVPGWEGDGPVVMAVDTLPAELPRESSLYFGDLLLPFVPDIAGADYRLALEDLALAPEVKRAVIAHHGRLAPAYERLTEHLAAAPAA